MWVYHILFMRPSVNGRLDSFHFWAMNTVAVNICVQVLWRHNFSTSLSKYRGTCWIIWSEHVEFCERLPGGLLKRTTLPSFLPTINESSCCSTSLPAFHVISVPGFDCFSSCLVVACCFNFYFLDDIWGGPFFICIFAACLSSLVECLLRSLAIFKIGLFVFLLLHFKDSVYFE